MEKKLGKPNQGIDGMRKLTAAEAKITGLTTSIYVHVEDTGILQFWRSTNSNELSRVLTGDARRDADQKLEKFWRK